MIYRTIRTAGRRGLRHPCHTCGTAIRAGEPYYRMTLRGSRGEDRIVVHKTCQEGKRQKSAPASPKERLVVVTPDPVYIHFPLGTSDDDVNEYLDGIELGHCSWDDAATAPSDSGDHRFPRMP